MIAYLVVAALVWILLVAWDTVEKPSAVALIALFWPVGLVVLLVVKLIELYQRRKLGRAVRELLAEDVAKEIYRRKAKPARFGRACR